MMEAVCAASLLYGPSFPAKNSLRRSSASLCQFSSSQGCVASKVLMNVNDTVDGSEIRRSPVDIGRFSQFFTRF